MRPTTPALAALALLMIGLPLAAQPSTRPLPSQKGGPMVAVLCYHHVDCAAKTKYSVTSAQLEEQLDALKAAGFVFIEPGALEAFYREGAELPPKSVLVTFDDGYYDAYLSGYPILKRKGIPFVFFVYPHLANSGHGRSAAAWDELKDMAAHGASIGCHSMSHLYLTQPPASVKTKAAYDAWLDKELVASKAEIEAKTGSKVSEFAVPFGAFDSYVRDRLRGAGYALAYNVNGVCADIRSDPWNVSRIIVEGNMKPADLVALASAPPIYFDEASPGDLARVRSAKPALSFKLDDAEDFDESTVKTRVGSLQGAKLSHQDGDDRFVESVDLGKPGFYGVRVSARDRRGRLCRGMWFFIYESEVPDFLKEPEPRSGLLSGDVVKRGAALYN